MGEYKTIINVNLDGAGVTYYVKEDTNNVKNMFENIDFGTGEGFKFVVLYDAMKNRDLIIKMLMINPSSCASVEIYENNGKVW